MTKKNDIEPQDTEAGEEDETAKPKQPAPEPAPGVSRNRPLLSRKALAITILTVAVVCLVIGFIAAKSSQSGSPDPEMIYNTVLQKVQEVTQMTVVEYYLSDIIKVSSESPWYEKDKKMLIICNARISAGFDLKDNSFTIDRSNPSSIVVTLPEPQITAIEPAIAFYDIQGKPDPDLYTYALNSSRRKLSNKAISVGILEKAKQFVLLPLANMVAAPGVKVTIIFKNPESSGKIIEPTPDLLEATSAIMKDPGQDG